MQPTIRAAACLAGTALAILAPVAAGQTLVKRSDPTHWTLKTTLNVRAWQERPRAAERREAKPLEMDVFTFESAAIVWPILDSTASSERDFGVPTTAILKLNDRGVTPEPVPPEIAATVYHSGTRLGVWKLRDWTGREVGLQLDLTRTCFSTEVDEDYARTIDWPQKWSDVAKSTFEPQLFIDEALGEAPDLEPIKRTVQRWTGGQDPKSVKPYELAKWFAGRAVEEIRRGGGTGLEQGRTGELEGVNIRGAWDVARTGNANDLELVCFLTACYRTAGLPARTVIGWDTADAASKEFLSRDRNKEGIRAWVEFCLVDPRTGRDEWIPVDVAAMRARSNRVGDIARPWRYFGTHDELSGIIPFAFQFFPPTTVRSYGSPGFWGWLVTPKPPDRAEQVLRFVAIKTANSTEIRRRRDQHRDPP